MKKGDTTNTDYPEETPSKSGCNGAIIPIRDKLRLQATSKVAARGNWGVEGGREKGVEVESGYFKSTAKQ